MRNLPFFTFITLAATAAGYGLYIWIHQQYGPDTVTVSRHEITHAIYATGVVEPVYWTKLAPEKTGRLTEIIHNEGSSVTRGDVVGRMESRQVEERLEEARAHLSYAAKEAARSRILIDSGGVSRSHAEDTERELKEASGRVHAIEREIEDLKLITPIDGVVLRREAEIGETVQAGVPVFWVGKPKPLRITAEVDEEDIGRVKPGQTSLLKMDAFPNQVFEGHVSEITPQGDPVNKVFRVRIALPDDAPLLINMTAEVNIITERMANALVIPSTSEADGFVWRIAEGRPVKTLVKIGLRNDTQLQVLEGLHENDVILRNVPVDKEHQP